MWLGIPSTCTDCVWLTWVMWLILNLVVHLPFGVLTQTPFLTPYAPWVLCGSLGGLGLISHTWIWYLWTTSADAVERERSLGMNIRIDSLWYRALFSGHYGFDASMTPYAILNRCIGTWKPQIHTLVTQKLLKVLTHGSCIAFG